jgi:lipopolysaccharide transport system permease protein
MPQELIIEAGRTEGQYWRDLWRYRELFYFLAWRDFLIRYKQTYVGVLWALVRPVLTMLILTMISKFGKLSTAGVPAPLFYLCALLPWQFFSTTLSESSTSFVYNANLVSKIYFPRLVVPASSVIVSFVDFAISAVFLFLLMCYYRFVPPPAIVFLPVFVLLIFAASSGVGLWTAALTVKYRDFRFVVPFVIQFGLYASVMLQTSKVPEKWRLLYSLNPIIGIIDGFRCCILGGDNVIYWPGLVASILVIFFTLVTGLWYFRKIERILADII